MAKLSYLQRYEEQDDGIRFMPGLQLQLPGLPPLPDGILGDKILRQHLRTDLMKKPLSMEEVLKPQHSIDELNDVIQYFAWNNWDQLVLRASEGVSGLIPRQEYELYSFASCWHRWPELMRDAMERFGLNGLVEIGQKGRVPGSKINALHLFAAVGCPLMGRAIYLILDREKPDEFLPELNTVVKFWKAVNYGYRSDGYLFGSQARYQQRNLDEQWVERLKSSLKEFHDDNHSFNSLMAAVELLTFYVHLDCRLGMMDHGPWILPNGNPLIVRNLFLREDIYPWSIFCDDLPYAMIFAFEIDAEKAGFEEIRCIDIGTLNTRPAEYTSAIIRGSLWVRDEWNSEVREVDLEEARALWYEPISEASLKIYQMLARMPRRQLIENGAYVYYVGMIYPFLRELGVFEEFSDEYKIWEYDQRASDLYYEMDRNQFARVTVPTKLFNPDETGFALIPDTAKMWRSKYAYF
jgi:hypothetical protein